ncbi:MAG: hypothetical protein JEZ00_14675 [Anaerolineaceae bacterium]|nr:hypothetical protein [Anaerolineaceae bacterium]
MKIIPVCFLIIFFSAGCSYLNNNTNSYTNEYETMRESTSTEHETYDANETPFPDISDSDADGVIDNLDLCPEQAASSGLAGCLPLIVAEPISDLSLWYHLPIDPAGRINVAGDRLLVLTNYQAGTINIHDLADGTLLRSLTILDLLNDSPTLTPQGIILKNYDQQHWRLLDYSGKELYAANEELEIINQQANVLVSRAENTIFIRKLDDLEKIINQLPGKYVTLVNNATTLAITNPEPCTITRYALSARASSETLMFTPGSAICYQSAQFTADNEYLFFADEGHTTIVAINDLSEQKQFAGIPMMTLSDGLILLEENQLNHLQMPEGTQKSIIDLGSNTLHGLIYGPDDSWVAARTNNPQQSATNQITLIPLGNPSEQVIFQADNLQSHTDGIYTWSFGQEDITFYSGANYLEESRLITPPILGVQTAINNQVWLISSQDSNMYIYGY